MGDPLAYGHGDHYRGREGKLRPKGSRDWRRRPAGRGSGGKLMDIDGPKIGSRREGCIGSRKIISCDMMRRK